MTNFFLSRGRISPLTWALSLAIFSFAFHLNVSGTPHSVVGKVVMETWTGVSGTQVSSIPLDAASNRLDSLSSLQGFSNWGDNYGVRVRGYIVAPASGEYFFYISSDDYSQFWLSPDTTFGGKAMIASVSGWTNTLEWTKYPSQKSASVILEEGKSYFFEILMKEGTGGDHWAVGWTGPGIENISIIGGASIRSYVDPVLSDTEPPSVPQYLTCVHFTYITASLSWSAATDNMGLRGYNILVNGNKVNGLPVHGTTYLASGLTGGLTHEFAVQAVDLAGNLSDLSAPVTVQIPVRDLTSIPSMPVGMNLPSLNYYSSSIIFTNVMTTASDMFTYYDGGPWNSEQMSKIPRDESGYPLQVPYQANGQNQLVRFLINNFYTGRHVILFDGSGTITAGGVPLQNIGGKLFIDLNGKGGHVWLNITSSTLGDHIRNIRIIPEMYANEEEFPTFIPEFVEGLKPFHALRFMDWTHTNNSTQKDWSDRPSKNWYTQGGAKGICMEYGIELANLLDADAWICVPHKANDQYIRNMARLWREYLDPDQKIYIEYSNEIWNWQFQQSHYYTTNAPENEQYVQAGLKAVGQKFCNDPNSYCHPEKSAYMMARVFRIFEEEFNGEHASRLIRVAPVQHAWYGNTGRILSYLFNEDGIGCDVISPAGYFNFDETDHAKWLANCGVSPKEILYSVAAKFDVTSGAWTRGNAAFAKQYNVGYTVYEGGQHMQPWLQGEHCYNPSVWDAQVSPMMYDLYMKNFELHAHPDVDCSLFVAFSYMGERKSKYGSWGHLEGLWQIGAEDFMAEAPKYQALIDVSMPRTIQPPLIPVVDPDSSLFNPVTRARTLEKMVKVFPNPAKEFLHVNSSEDIRQYTIYTSMGSVVSTSYFSPGEKKVYTGSLPRGLYVVEVRFADQTTQRLKFVKE